MNIVAATAVTFRAAMSGLGFLFFLLTLGAADWGLSRWGTTAIRRRPRPGGRVTVLFLGVVAACAVLEGAAVALWSAVPVVSVFLLLAQVPSAAAVAVGLDRAMRTPPTG